MDPFLFPDYEKLFENCPHVNFFPHVGKNYFQSKKRILILGESHYGSKERDDSYRYMTIDTIDWCYLKWKSEGKPLVRWNRCYENTAKVISPIADAESYKIYSDVAFFNFFQKVIGEGNHAAKQFLTPELIQESRLALKEVLDVLKPDLVIVCGTGKLQWNWLPPARKNIWTVPGKLTLFTIDEYPAIPFWCIRHPSAFFSVTRYRERFALVKDYLQL